MKCPTCKARIYTRKSWFDTHEHGTCIGHLFWLIRQLSANQHSPKLTACIWALEEVIEES